MGHKKAFSNFLKQNPQSPWFCSADIIYFLARTCVKSAKESFQEERHFEVKYLIEAAKGGFNAVKVVTVLRFPPANINKHQIFPRRSKTKKIYQHGCILNDTAQENDYILRRQRKHKSRRS